MQTDSVHIPKVAPRLSLPLSEAERATLIDLKSMLQKQRRTLKSFIWGAILDRMQQEQARLGEAPVAVPAKKKGGNHA